MILLFSVFALCYIYYNKTINIVREYPQENIEPLNDFYYYNNKPRVINNVIYEQVQPKNDEYVEVEGEDEESYSDESLDDQQTIDTTYNYFKNNTKMTTQF